MDLLRIILVIFCSPLAVFLTVGLGSAFWINLLLYLCSFGLLGLVHGVWVIAKASRD